MRVYTKHTRFVSLLILSMSRMNVRQVLQPLIRTVKEKCACVKTIFAQAFFCFYKNNEQLLNGKEKTFARY